MSAFDVSVVGSINTDLSVFTDIVPSSGETVMGAEFVMGYGGKGANQCVASQFLGSKCAMVAKVGVDCFGEQYLGHLNAISVTTGGITRTNKANTGAAFITVKRDIGENRIIVVPGSNMLLSTADVDQADQAGFLNARVIVCQFEIDAATTLHALQLAHSKKIKTILNPAPPPRPTEEYGAQENFKLLSKILQACDYCCPNETEAFQLMRARGRKEICSSQDQSLKIYSQCLCWLAEQGVQNPIVTLGSKGLVALVPKSALPTHTTKDFTLQEEVVVKGQKKYVIHLAAPRVPIVVDTTGAGDCFVGAFAHFLALQESIGIVEQLRRAIWVASQSVRKVGTQSSYPKRNELPAALFAPAVFQWPDQ